MGADGFGTGDFADILGAGGGGLTGIGFGTCGVGTGGGDFAGGVTFGGTGAGGLTGIGFGTCGVGAGGGGFAGLTLGWTGAGGDAFVSSDCFKPFIALTGGTRVGLTNFGASGGGTNGTGTEAFAGAFGGST